MNPKPAAPPSLKQRLDESIAASDRISAGLRAARKKALDAAKETMQLRAEAIKQQTIQANLQDAITRELAARTRAAVDPKARPVAASR